MKHGERKLTLGAALASSAVLAASLLMGEPVAPQVSVAEVNPGTSVERGLCLTVGLSGGSSECGDLRLAHALPSVRTLNQVRTPQLTYSSQHASPNPIVAAEVALPSGTSGLSRVMATLKVNGTPRGQGVWRGTAWPAGTQPVRIAVGYDAAGDATGPYRYTLEVKACYGTSCSTTAASGQLVVVNRRESPLGAGWWVAGVERLVVDPFGKPMLWVGGDGSTRRYTAARGDSVWGAPSLGQPDTLKREGNKWVRLLSGGGRVIFDSQGNQVASRNRLGHTTEFWYGEEGRLDSIGVPPAVTRDGDMVYTTPRRLIRPYIFVYGTDRRLLRVDAPGGGEAQRITRVHHTGARVDSIVDPDGTRVRFGYESAPSLRVSSRTDRRNFRTDFRYDAGHRVAASHLWMDTLAAGDSIVTRLRAGESIGLAAADGTGAVPVAQAYAEIDGPRADPVNDRTRFWLGRWGAPQRVVNPLGDTVEVSRSNPSFPALVTRMRYPNGRVVAAEYDARGNVVATTDSSRSRTESGGIVRYATTRYEWDPRWDAVTKITLSEDEVTTYGYDPETGSRTWQQVGPDVARRVTFRYQATGTAQGMLSASTAPGAQKSDSVAYDRLGNLELMVSPRGARVEHRRDALGRDSISLVPLGGSLVQRHEVTYLPGTDLVDRSATLGPGMNGRAAQTLWIRNEYDAGGNVTAVERWSAPDLPAAAVGKIRTSWRYDAAGRAVAEIAPGSGTFTRTRFEQVCEGTTLDDCTQVPHDSTYTIEYRDSTVYDPAGNPIEVHTRRGNPATGAPLVIRMKYDALGRLEERTVPEVHYSNGRYEGIPRNYRSSSTAQCTGEMRERTYPSRPNDGGCGYRIEQDVHTFRYDAMGNLVRADNKDAQVRRQYNLDGSLRVDSLRIRATNSADFTAHEYGIEFEYDLNGRRTELKHPSQLAPSTAQSTVSYGYDPATGALEDVTDPLGNVFRYEYNMRGELYRKLFVDAGWDEYGYDEDGALSGHRTYRLLGQRTGEDFRRTELLRDARLVRDTIGRLKQASNAVGRRDTVTSNYSGQGHAVLTTSAIYGDTTSVPTLRARERFAYDALGNASADTSFQSVKYSWYRNETEVRRSFSYGEGTGRLILVNGSITRTDTRPVVSPTTTVNRGESYRYDTGGNQEFVTQSYRSNGSCSSEDKVDADCEDRVSFYAADGTLRAAEQRVRMGEDDTGYWSDTFEEYRYDALGRRVWVRSRMACPTGPPGPGWPFVPCYSSIRRTVWDGDSELWEIQMPGQDGSAYLENDVLPVPVQEFTSYYPDTKTDPQPWDGEKFSRFDPNPRFGRVAYTHGHGVDQPISIIRIGLNRYYEPPLRHEQSSAPPAQGVTFAPFAVVPLTDWRGHADAALYAGGAKQHCETFSGTQRCTSLIMGQAWSAYGHEDPSALEWHGTLLTGKRDATGTLYRRARYYDPQSGRFTQEDPLGLGGGVNLYGYAGSDPVNSADPSGMRIKVRDVLPWIPVVAFAVTFRSSAAGPLSAGAAFAGTAKAFAATAVGSAAAAGLQATASGTSFTDAFVLNFAISSGFLGVGTIAADIVGETTEVGANGLYQGYIRMSKPIGGSGLTIGSAAVLGYGRDEKIPSYGILGLHERGHTAQFILLSASGKNPWYAYTGLGIMGIIQSPYTHWWEDFAGWLGGTSAKDAESPPS